MYMTRIYCMFSYVELQLNKNAHGYGKIRNWIYLIIVTTKVYDFGYIATIDRRR